MIVDIHRNLPNLHLLIYLKNDANNKIYLFKV